MTQSTLDYARRRLKSIMKETNAFKNIIWSDNGLAIELHNGMNLELSEAEIKNQAYEYLQSELEHLKTQ